MTGQCRRQDNVASLRVLVSKPELLLVAATRFAMRDTIPSDIVLSCSLPVENGDGEMAKTVDDRTAHHSY